MDNSEENPYYRWWYGVEKAGVPMHAVTEYYTETDPESLFTITFNGDKYTYPILTKPEWNWTTHPDYSFSFNDELRQVDYEWYYITSAVSRMAYAADRVSVNNVGDLEEYVWNGNLYTVNRIEDETVEVILSDFYSVLSSAEPYIAELNSFLYNSSVSQATSTDDVASIIQSTDEAFPIRNESAQTLDDIVESSSMTELPIGGTYPVILRTEDGFECIVSRRSTEVKSWPEYWTVIPAGYFAPDGIDNRLGVLNQFYSEYCEELFGAVEGSVTGQNDKVREVELEMERGESEFVVTGLGVEGVGLSFEVSGAYIVYDVDVAENIKNSLDSNYEITDLDFLNLNDVEAVRDFLTPTDVTPPSVFAFVNALKFLKTRLSTNEQPESVKQL